MKEVYDFRQNNTPLCSITIINYIKNDQWKENQDPRLVLLSLNLSSSQEQSGCIFFCPWVDKYSSRSVQKGWHSSSG